MKPNPWATCDTCNEYMVARIDAIGTGIAKKVLKSGESPGKAIADYMNGVHERHTAGLPILTNDSQEVPA